MTAERDPPVVTEVAPCGGPALADALALAGAIAANGPVAVAASKRVIVVSRLWSEEEM